jgi:hypothetical protein
MRTTTKFGAMIGAAAVAACAGLVLAGDGAGPPAADARFVVHEWGTFTSMQGADGVALEGLSREEEALPDFVYSRAKIRECPLRAKGWKGLEVPADHVTQKMETPVMYFHSATPRRVRVRVDFMHGLVSQWYPVCDLLGPPEGARDAAPLDVSKIERSFLQWDVDVRPEGESAPDERPDVAGGNPWAFARDVRASWLRTLPRKAPREGPVEAERYLFYRGIGNFRTPLAVNSEPDGAYVLTNSGDAAIDSPIVMEVKGDKGRMTVAESVAAGGRCKAQLHGGEWWGPIDDVEEKLKAFVAQRLVAAGLRDDEARAMVRTWSRSWFKSQGARVLWVLPRAQTDALLPLYIDPKPDEIVRVLVGRTEVITPEQEAEDYAALADVASGDRERAPRGAAVLESRGRFVEPHLRRAIAAVDARKDAPRRDDAAVRACAAGRLEKMAATRSPDAAEEEPFRR